MKPMSLNEIRSKFLAFFETKDHYVQSSFSLVPQNDKSLLLINSGMAPLKNYFVGVETPPNVRMATCQKCIRTGDIENVGHTSRHATMFEMLGNFSFGDYFKKESIAWGWEFVTEWLEMPVDKLWVTVYLDDDEAYDIWHQEIGIPKERIVRLGKKDNFWEIGVGPCGPCSEIYFDRGEENGCGLEGCAPGCDCDRYVEFWNHVFTQFDRDEAGNYNRLAKPNIDTGMGLERVACLMQNVSSIFEIDTIKHILDAVVVKVGKPYGEDETRDVSIRIITDHIRAVSFMIADGILPNNEGRGYVLRRLLRRAARHGKLLGIKDNFLFDLVDAVVAVSKEAYPSLAEKQSYVKKVVAIEEDRFQQTLDQGLEILNSYIQVNDSKGVTVLTGAEAFKLYDTYGFPLDLTKEILEERGMTVDEDSFVKEMTLQKERARSARESQDTAGWKDESLNLDELGSHSTFTGYEGTSGTAKILALWTEEGVSQNVMAGESVRIILNTTPFYGESGGQAGDTGVLTGADFAIEITDTHKGLQNAIVHYGRVTEGVASVGAEVTATVTKHLRMDTMRNHTATHLLHQALRDVLGDHVNQAGSLVDSNGLRFDFTHFQGLSDEELQQVEYRINQKILEDLPVRHETMGIKEAKERGATALFGEKYGDIVRVITVDGYSVELCGGTHVHNTGTIGLLKILSENGVAAGVRRIEALTGRGVYTHLTQLDKQVQALAHTLKTTPADLETKVQHLMTESKAAQKALESMKQKQANDTLGTLIQSAKEINGIHVVVGAFEDLDVSVLRNLGDQIKSQFSPSVAVLGLKAEGKLTFLAMADDAALQKGVHCGQLVKAVAGVAGGSGGGKPGMAQAGAPETDKLQEALNSVYTLI